MFEVPLMYNKLLTSHSNLTDYEVDIISGIIPVRELGINEAGNLSKATLDFELTSPKVEIFFPLPSEHNKKTWHLHLPLLKVII